MSVLKRIQFEDISAASKNIWSNREIADKIAIDAFEIISSTSRRKFAFFTGKKSKCLIGGLFYQWLEAFPDLFSDVIGKFEADGNLKFFVLLNLDHTTA